jgi:hypothetical protein
MTGARIDSIALVLMTAYDHDTYHDCLLYTYVLQLKTGVMK